MSNHEQPRQTNGPASAQRAPAPSVDATVRLEGLRFGYRRGAAVLDGLDMEFGPGITLLRGYSGCGKSTVLKLIAGFLKPNAGRVRVPPYGGPPSVAFRRVGLGFVSQGVNLIRDASVRRNFELSAAFGPPRERDVYAHSERLLEELRLVDVLGRKVRTLSVGQAQRVAVARAVVRDPLVLCLDEPTSGLDDVSTECVMGCLQRFARPGRICIIATHDARLNDIAQRVIQFESDA